MDVATALIEREPVTIVVSEKGWIRALKGHVADLSTLTFKGDDQLAFQFFAETTSKILLFASDGKVFTLEASKLPGGRGHGEPLRLMVDLGEGEEVTSIIPYETGAKLLLTASDGRGFIVGQDDLIGTTRKGKQVLNCDAPAKLSHIVPAAGDHLAIIGENRKLLIFPLVQIAEMTRGKGVRLQKYKDGGVSDAKVIFIDAGLSWQDAAGRSFHLAKADLADWIGQRGEAGRLPPRGFPKNNRFTG